MSRDGSVETWSKLVLGRMVAEAFGALPYCVWTPAAGVGFGRSKPTYLGSGRIGIIGAGAKTPLLRIPVADELRPQLLSCCAELGIETIEETAKASS